MAEVLDFPTSRIHAWARQGLLRPDRGAGNRYVFSFRDLALLRAARELLQAEVSLRAVRRALEALRGLLPPGEPLSAVELTALGGRVLVREEDRLWDPDTGQLALELPTDAVADPPGDVHPLAPRRAAPQGRHAHADDLFDRGVELEGREPAAAREAYRRALALDPGHADAYLNLGRLLHQDRELDEAELQYRAAVQADPMHARAWYNLGVLMEDRDRTEDAREAYESALAVDPGLAVAHYNLALLHEAEEREAEALRHLSAYKRLVEGRGPR